VWDRDIKYPSGQKIKADDKEGGRGTAGEVPEGLVDLETRDPLEGVVLDEEQTLRNLADINWRTPPVSSQFARQASQTNLRSHAGRIKKILKTKGEINKCQNRTKTENKTHSIKLN